MATNPEITKLVDKSGVQNTGSVDKLFFLSSEYFCALSSTAKSYFPSSSGCGFYVVGNNVVQFNVLDIVLLYSAKSPTDTEDIFPETKNANHCSEALLVLLLQCCCCCFTNGAINKVVRAFLVS